MIRLQGRRKRRRSRFAKDMLLVVQVVSFVVISYVCLVLFLVSL